ncbi:MAG: hypothetical protein KC503_31070 [Myxococcales bacterium]|nr:hypothetical protein [Myxococcales bacterium]
MRNAILALIVAMALSSPALAEGDKQSRGHTVARAKLSARTLQYLDHQRLLMARHVEHLRRVHARRVPIALGNVVLRSLSSSLSFDYNKQTVSTTNVMVIEGSAPGVATLNLYMTPLSGGGPPAVSDAQGTLQTLNQGNGLYTVVLRQPLGAGSSLTLTVARSGAPQCSTQFLNIVSCMLSTSMTFSVGGAWEPLIYDLTSGELITPLDERLAITVPSNLVVAASGDAGAVDDNGDGTRTHHFKGVGLGHGISFSAAAYVSGSYPFGANKASQSYVLPQSSGFADSWRKQAAAIIDFHGKRYGDYPHKTISMAEVPDVTGAAFGPPLTVFMPSSTLAFDPGHWAATRTLAHELGHQWFAGLIAVGENYSPWLAEGFASFAEMRYTAERALAEAKIDYAPIDRRSHRLEVIYGLQPQNDVPISSQQIYQVPSDAYVTLTYTKGAMVANMLRYLLGGDTNFDAAMRGVRADHAGGSGLTVKSLAASLAKHSGVDVNAFLDRWAFGSGYPTYKVEVVRGEDGAADIRITSAKAFALPLELDILAEDGSSQRVRVQPNSDGVTFEHHVAGGAARFAQVRVDPDQHLVRRVLGAEPGDIVLDGDVDGIDLIWAARAVGERYSQQAGQATQFSDYADLQFDGVIDQQDLDIVLNAFGTRSGGNG